MEKTVYILSGTPDGGVYRYRLSDSGNLTLVEKAPLDRPMYGAIEANTLYILLRAPFADSKDTGLVRFSLRKGTLAAHSQIESTRGEVAAHLCVEGEAIYVANYISGNVVKMPDTVVAHSGRSVHPTRQSSPHTHYVGLTPDGRYLCVVDLGLDKVLVYDRQLHPVSQTDFPPGNGPRHLAWSDDGVHVYCANELSSTVTVLTYANGQLTPVREYTTLPNGYTGDNAPAAIRYQDGYVYVSNRGHNSIASYRAEGDTLTPVAITPCGGISPRDFLLVGNRLLCANESSDSVALFTVQEGRLAPLDEIAIPKPQCILALNETGLEGISCLT